MVEEGSAPAEVGGRTRLPTLFLYFLHACLSYASEDFANGILARKLNVPGALMGKLNGRTGGLAMAAPRP